MWMPLFCCPTCQAPLTVAETAADCLACRRRYSRTDWLFHLIAPEVAERMAPFVAQYRAVRSADGHGSRSVSAYRALPDVPPDDPLAAEWRVRRRSYDALCRTFQLHSSTGLRILDLGAGNGWLSNRLARAGHWPVAVDVNDDACDGLRVCHLYEDSFPLVQAHVDYLPFAPGQFDLVVLNASLHYAADPVQTLVGASGLLGNGGSLVVMDSPLFEKPEDGDAMVAGQTEHLRLRCGIAQPVRPGVGFITVAMLDEAAAAMGRCAAFIAHQRTVFSYVERFIRRRMLGRAPAAFGLWATQ